AAGAHNAATAASATPVRRPFDTTRPPLSAPSEPGVSSWRVGRPVARRGAVTALALDARPQHPGQQAPERAAHLVLGPAARALDRLERVALAGPVRAHDVGVHVV